MEMTKEELNEIIERHGKWIYGEEGGVLADLSGADLSGADLSGVDLSVADLRGANLREANLKDADLREADINGADLRGAYLFGVIIDKYMYQITGCGSFYTTTTYDVRNNQVIWGCWICNDGNTLENFEKMIEDIYGENGEKPNKKYYQEYMLAIDFFKATKKLED